jgi:hypothetical protein
MGKNWKLSPSDLTFLWDDCKRCFYLKVVHDFKRPWSPFPKIFNRIDKLMKEHFEGKSTKEISEYLPAGKVKFGEKWVTSQPVTIPGQRGTCFIRGKFDTVVAFDDGTFGIVDFKTSEPKPTHVDFYSRQLHAYAHALENPAPGSLSLAPITKLGLLCVEPTAMDYTDFNKVAYIGDVSWMECPRDDKAFFDFLGQVLAVLENDSPPDANPSCAYCQYRDAARGSSF